MRKPLLVLLTILMFCAFAAFAQDKTSSPPSSASPSAQDSSQSSTGTSAGEQTIEGCIVRQATTYYIQPSSGSPPAKLSGSPDVASHEGHQVVVHGSQQSSSASSAGNTNPGSSSAASGQSSTSSADQTFNVTRVDMIATNCPMGKDTSNPK